MSRVITFSREFPSYHPRKGEQTYFVEKITRSLHMMGNRPNDINCDFDEEMYYICEPKNHTIRAGNRWKVGDKFSPRVWSDKPYRSKQITIAPDIEVKRVWAVQIEKQGYHWIITIPCKDDLLRITGYRSMIPLGDVAMNDGLSVIDFQNWFDKPFSGQIICWNENIDY